MNRTEYTQRQVIVNIILAQIASDAGKGIYNLWIKDSRVSLARQKGYSVKDQFIISAIKIIDSNPKCGVNYWCTSAPDQNGYGSVLTYFDIEFYGIRYQVSFHTPVGQAKALMSHVNKGRKTHWIRRDSRSQIDSRESCAEMAHALNL